MAISRKTVSAAVFCLALLAPPSTNAQDALFTQKFLTLEIATELAQATLKFCRDKGFQIAVTVVDRAGSTQVTLRDRFAGPHTPDTAYRKAWTALSFRTNTTDLAKLTEKGEAWAIRGVSKALPLGGGVLIREGAGSFVGAVGVSGAPAPAADEDCAKAGIAAIQDKISF